MRLTFLGAAQTVTGSKYLIEAAGKKILVDCGLFQGLKELRLKNWEPPPVDPKTVDYVILTHAHIDHSGYLPLFVKNGFNGKIICSAATYDLCQIMLLDSAKIQEEDANYANRKGFSKHKPAIPLYNVEDATKVFKLFHPIKHHQEFVITNDLSLLLTPSGHILGANFVTIKNAGKQLVFSGDIGRFEDPIMRAPEPIKYADFLVVESTYGDRLHIGSDPKKMLAKVINDTTKRGGVVLIPAFAVGRNQLILYYLYQLQMEGKIPGLPIYVDSPMATNVSRLYSEYAYLHRLTEEQINAIFSMAEYVMTSEDSKRLDEEVFPKIIVSASGMATGGRIVHHLERFLGDSRNTVLFTSYQAIGTRGSRLVAGEKSLKMHGKMITVKAEIKNVDNLSAHADYNEILRWLAYVENTPQQVFITHGRLDASKAAARKIKQRFGWNCQIPEYLESVEL